MNLSILYCEYKVYLKSFSFLYIRLFVLLKILCGNKVDLETERKITTKDGEKAAEKLGIPFVETSAKTGHNVVEAYHELVRHIPRSDIEYKVSFEFRCLTNQFDFQRTCL